MRDTAPTVTDAALLRIDPAELVTRESPSCALEAVCWAVSLALVAPEDAALAASSVVEAARLWRKNLDCRTASRGSMGVSMAAGREMKRKNRCVVVVG